MSDALPLLQIRGLTKRFPGVVALDAVDLDVAAGEIHALVGENGAGKSTLIRVLAGATRADGGMIRFGDAPFAPVDPRDAVAHGVATIHQEVPLVPDVSVAENLFIGRRVTRFGFVARKETRRRATAALERIGARIDVDRRAGDLKAAERQLLWIARALDQDAKLLVMDEPTSSLDRAETLHLLDLVKSLAARGVGVLFVSHRLDEVFAVASRITVLRNGKVAATLDRASTTPLDVVRAMLGREPTAGAPVSHEVYPGMRGTPVLEAKGLASAHVSGVDLAIGKGEIVGLAGLLGSGRTETIRLVFGAGGADARIAGTLALKGQEIRRGSPRRSLLAGMLLCPEERRVDALFPSLTVAENMVIAALPRLTRFGFVDEKKVAWEAYELFERLPIKARDVEQAAGELSGGNQQKVLLARALLTRPVVLLLDEPTRGIDVGARAEIEKLVRKMVEEGLAVLLVSSSLDELLPLSHRVVVLKDGRVVKTLAGGREREAEVVAAIAGDSAR